MTKTARIRWHETPGADPAWTGSAGTVDPSLFQIYAPDHFAPQWILTTSFPGMEDKRSYADGPDTLKAEAERWLEEFTSSLSAVFGDALLELADRWQQFAADGDAQDECARELRENHRWPRFGGGRDCGID